MYDFVVKNKKNFYFAFIMLILCFSSYYIGNNIYDTEYTIIEPKFNVIIDDFYISDTTTGNTSYSAEVYSVLLISYLYNNTIQENSTFRSIIIGDVYLTDYGYDMLVISGDFLNDREFSNKSLDNTNTSIDFMPTTVIYGIGLIFRYNDVYYMPCDYASHYNTMLIIPLLINYSSNIEIEIHGLYYNFEYNYPVCLDYTINGMDSLGMYN